MREIKLRAWFDGHMYEVAKLDFWVGFELDQDYYRESSERLKNYMKQITFFHGK